MENGTVENGGVCSAESVNGGKDVFSSKESDVSSADHLVVMVHGILGRSEINLLIYTYSFVFLVFAVFNVLIL